MGIPSDVLAGQLGGLRAVPAAQNARTVVVVTASGGPNLLLGPPPAGFTRRCVVDSVIVEGNVTVMNPTGGSNVQVDFLFNGFIYEPHPTNILPGGTPFKVENVPYLGSGDSLFGTYTAGASTLHWVISYTDYPAADLVSFDVPLINGDTIVVPTPASGKSHILDGIGQFGAGVYIYNPGGNTPSIFSKVNGLQVDDPAAVAATEHNYVQLAPGLAIDDTNVSLALNADATGARAHGAYWVVDKGSN